MIPGGEQDSKICAVDHSTEVGYLLRRTIASAMLVTRGAAAGQYKFITWRGYNNKRRSDCRRHGKDSVMRWKLPGSQAWDIAGNMVNVVSVKRSGEAG